MRHLETIVEVLSPDVLPASYLIFHFAISISGLKNNSTQCERGISYFIYCAQATQLSWIILSFHCKVCRRAIVPLEPAAKLARHVDCSPSIEETSTDSASECPPQPHAAESSQHHAEPHTPSASRDRP